MSLAQYTDLRSQIERHCTTSRGHLVWNGATIGAKPPYGRVKVAGRLELAHRMMWLAEHGKIPRSIRKTCSRDLCILPAHWRENVAKTTPATRENKTRLNRQGHLRRHYGIGIAEYEAMIEAQAGVCAACGEPPEEGRVLEVDHCHDSGEIRALLCWRCNRALGFIQDSPARLDALVAYMKNFA